MALHDHRWAFQPVDPVVLYHLLRDALGVGGSNKDPKEIVSAPMPDVECGNFRDLYLLREVLRKYPNFKLGVDTRQVALDAFYADEATNSQTNDRLLGLPPLGAVATIIQMARKKISKILGQFDENEFWNSWRFGPHSTISLKRLEALTENKLSLTSPASSIEARPLFRRLLSENPFWAYSMGVAVAEPQGLDNASRVCHLGMHIVDMDKIKICQFDRWTSVRKNAKTDRGIGIPPDGNVLLQLAVGKMLRRRLFQAGINLNDQSINQEWARNGSLTGDVATVDVRAASQSLTCGLVWNLIGSQSHRELDPRWYMVMEALRTSYTLVDGKLHENELFSAMGNGFTFELESLVFYSLAWATTAFLHEDTHSVSVYGDDIILPSGAFELLTRVFEHCGFGINQDKSFATTGEYRFRESCGKHFRNGVDVTPFYVDEGLDQPFQIILLANNLRRWASNGQMCDGRLYPVWLWILSHLGTGYRACGIPNGESNDGIIMDWDECCPPSARMVNEDRLSSTHIGWKASTVEFVPRGQILPDEPRYLRWQYHNSGHSGFKPPAVPKLGGRTFTTWPHWVDTVEPSLRVVPKPPRARGAKVGLRHGSRVVSSWPGPGPWVTESIHNRVDIEVALALIEGRRLTRLPAGFKPKASKKRK